MKKLLKKKVRKLNKNLMRVHRVVLGRKRVKDDVLPTFNKDTILALSKIVRFKNSLSPVEFRLIKSKRNIVLFVNRYIKRERRFFIRSFVSHCYFFSSFFFGISMLKTFSDFVSFIVVSFFDELYNIKHNVFFETHNTQKWCFQHALLEMSNEVVFFAMFSLIRKGIYFIRDEKYFIYVKAFISEILLYSSFEASMLIREALYNYLHDENVSKSSYKNKVFIKVFRNCMTLILKKFYYMLKNMLWFLHFFGFLFNSIHMAINIAPRINVEYISFNGILDWDFLKFGFVWRAELLVFLFVFEYFFLLRILSFFGFCRFLFHYFSWITYEHKQLLSTFYKKFSSLESKRKTYRVFFELEQSTKRFYAFSTFCVSWALVSFIKSFYKFRYKLNREVYLFFLGFHDFFGLSYIDRYNFNDFSIFFFVESSYFFKVYLETLSFNFWRKKFIEDLISSGFLRSSDINGLLCFTNLLNYSFYDFFIKLSSISIHFFFQPVTDFVDIGYFTARELTFMFYWNSVDFIPPKSSLRAEFLFVSRCFSKEIFDLLFNFFSICFLIFDFFLDFFSWFLGFLDVLYCGLNNFSKIDDLSKFNDENNELIKEEFFFFLNDYFEDNFFFSIDYLALLSFRFSECFFMVKKVVDLRLGKNFIPKKKLGFNVVADRVEKHVEALLVYFCSGIFGEIYLQSEALDLVFRVYFIFLSFLELEVIFVSFFNFFYRLILRVFRFKFFRRFRLFLINLENLFGRVFFFFDFFTFELVLRIFLEKLEVDGWLEELRDIKCKY